MRQILPTGAAMFITGIGLALFSGRAGAGDPPANPPKDVAPKNGAPKDATPAQPAPQPKANKDPKENAPREPAKNPREPAAAPRDTNSAPRENAPNPRNAAPSATTPAPRATNPAPGDATSAPRTGDQRSADQRATTRNLRQQTHRTDRELGITFGRVTERGLAISDLGKSSSLFSAGLRPGDFVVSVNGRRIERPDDFDRLVFAVDGDERITTVVWRDGREETVYLEPTVFYVDESYDDDIAYFGVVFDDRYPDRLIVRRVLRDTPAFLAGLREGDEITTWHGERIVRPADFGRTLHRIEPGTVDFEIMRDSKSLRTEAKFGRREPVNNAKGGDVPTREPR
jgi:PDZ domain